jgi:hypothetical protein
MSKIVSNRYNAGENWQKLRLIKIADHQNFPLTAIFQVSKGKLIIIPEVKKPQEIEAIVIKNKQVAKTFTSFLFYLN